VSDKRNPRPVEVRFRAPRNPQELLIIGRMIRAKLVAVASGRATPAVIIDLVGLLRTVQATISCGAWRSQGRVTLDTLDRVAALRRAVGWLADNLGTREGTEWVFRGDDRPPEVPVAVWADLDYAAGVQATADSASDEHNWILASEAVALLDGIRNLRDLYAYAKDNPGKLRMRRHPEHPRRRQVHAGDVVRLMLEQGRREFEALEHADADLPSISEDGLLKLARRLESERRKKADNRRK